jgi:hypothetical protein
MDTGTPTQGTRTGGATEQRGTASSPAGDSTASPAAKGGPAAGAPEGEPASGTQQTAGTAGEKTSGEPSAAGQRAGEKSAGEKSDEEILAEALEELQRRNGGAPAEDGQQQGARPGTPGTPGQAETDEEKVRALHRELSERFAKFDQTILTETETVREEDAAAGNRGFSDRDRFEKGGEETAAVDPGAAGTPPPLPGTLPGEKDPAASSRSDIPPDLVSAEGDDIIARQLREAAMKEQDPELRAKLWDEYRKYKRGMK